MHFLSKILSISHWSREAREKSANSLAREHDRDSSGLLGVDRVDGPVVVIALDVRVDVRPVLAGVDAMRTPEARRLAALVL